MHSRRLTLTLEALKGAKIIVVVDETGDRKKATKTDYRLTNFEDINKWWEIIMSAYLMITLNTQVFLSLNISDSQDSQSATSTIDFSVHPQWNHQTAWKNVLNNFRLIIQPTLLLWLIFPWLEVFPNSSLLLGFHHLIEVMNQFKPFFLSG